MLEKSIDDQNIKDKFFVIYSPHYLRHIVEKNINENGSNWVILLSVSVKAEPFWNKYVHKCQFYQKARPKRTKSPIWILEGVVTNLKSTRILLTPGIFNNP